MAEREAKRLKTKDSDHPDIIRQDVILRMSMKGLSIDSIVDVLKMEPGEVLRILEQAESLTEDTGSVSSKDSTHGLGMLVKRLMNDPPELCCPISHALMEDPVVAGDGFTYERSFIEGCLQSKAQSPMTGAIIETQVLHPNQDRKSEILSFKEKTVSEILSVAPRLPSNLASQVLPRAEEFVRAQLPDASARRQLSTLLLLKVKLPDIRRNVVAQEIVSLLVQVQDDGQLQQFLCETEESELAILLSNLEDEMVANLHKAMQTTSTKYKNCKAVIDKEFVSRLASCEGADSLKKLWELLLANSKDGHEWTRAAAVVLASYIDTLEVSLEELDVELVGFAREAFEDQDGTRAFAEKFFKNDLGISRLSWPPLGAAKILFELAWRLPLDDDMEAEKFDLLLKAYSIDGKDISIRKALKTQLHQLLLAEDTIDRDMENLFLELVLQDKEEIPQDVLPKLSLRHVQQLSGDQLIFLAQQLGALGKTLDAGRLAIIAARRFTEIGKEREAQDAFLKAFRWDHNNPDAANGLVTIVMEMRKENEDLKQRCEDVENLKQICKDLQTRCGSLERLQKEKVPLMTFVWDLTDYDFTSFVKGDIDFQDSDEFEILPGINAAISLYPKGDARSPSGMAALYLWVEEPIKIKVRLQGGHTDWILEHDFATTLDSHGETRARGRKDFMPTSEIGDSIVLQVLSVQSPNSSVKLVAPN